MSCSKSAFVSRDYLVFVKMRARQLDPVQSVSRQQDPFQRVSRRCRTTKLPAPRPDYRCPGAAPPKLANCSRMEWRSEAEPIVDSTSIWQLHAIEVFARKEDHILVASSRRRGPSADHDRRGSQHRVAPHLLPPKTAWPMENKRVPDPTGANREWCAEFVRRQSQRRTHAEDCSTAMK